MNVYKSISSNLLFLLHFSFSRWGSQENNLLFINIMWAFSSTSKCTIKFFYGTLILPQNIWPSSILEPLWIHLLNLLLNHIQVNPWVPLCLCECFSADEETHCFSYFYCFFSCSIFTFKSTFSPLHIVFDITISVTNSNYLLNTPKHKMTTFAALKIELRT